MFKYVYYMIILRKDRWLIHLAMAVSILVLLLCYTHILCSTESSYYLLTALLICYTTS